MVINWFQIPSGWSRECLLLRLGLSFFIKSFDIFGHMDEYQILTYISAMSQTYATGCLLNGKRTFTRTCCNFGSWWITSLSDFLLNFASPSKTIFTLFVDLLGRNTGKCGRNHPSFRSSLSTLSRYTFSKYWAINWFCFFSSLVSYNHFSVLAR